MTDPFALWQSSASSVQPRLCFESLNQTRAKQRAHSRKKVAKSEGFSFAERAAPQKKKRGSTEKKEVLQKIFEQWCSSASPRNVKGKLATAVEESPRLPEWAFLKLCRVTHLANNAHLLADYARIYRIALNTPQEELEAGDEEGLSYEGA